jgi:hypothetical protein
MRGLLTLMLVVLTSGSSFAAQNAVRIVLDQRLNGAPFVMNTVVSHPDGGSQGVFRYTLLRYYISGIEITHDGGKVTKLSSAYVLVDATWGSTYEIGTHDITSVEAVKLSIGVDEGRNHLDPTTFPPNHALYPQQPSMHWGWSAGYRFITAEGFAGANADNVKTNFQLHGLGDQNYFSASMPMTATAVTGVLTLPITAEYANLLKGIQVIQGVIEHSDAGPARDILVNATTSVFSASAPTSVDEELTAPISLAPNPAFGAVTVTAPVGATISLVDQTGSIVRTMVMDAPSQTFDHSGLAQGSYAVVVRTPSGIHKHERLVVLQ